MIKQRTMGRTGLQVSELCLGTMNFGWKTDAPQSFAILDAYRAAGGNFIQAMGHCPAPTISSASTVFSEDVVGRWWQARAIPRNEVILATRLNLGRPPAGVSVDDFVQECCRASLRRLQTTYLDILILEWSDALPRGGRTLELFDGLVRNGLARYVGAANFPAWRIADLVARASSGNHCRMEVLQSDYSLMTRARFEPETMALCSELRLGFIARSPLAGGFLARGPGTAGQFNSARHDWIDQRWGNAYGAAGLAAVGDVAGRHKASSAQIALAWVLHSPRVTSALIGVQSPAQLNELVGAGRIRLSHLDRMQLAEATATEEIQLAAALPGPQIPSLEPATRKPNPAAQSPGPRFLAHRHLPA